MSIRITNLTYQIGDATLLDDVSVEVSKGTIVAVVGPNGSGKTSLIKAASGEIRVNQGEARICGQNIQSLSLSERARMIAVLPQESALDFPFTVEEVVHMGRIPHLASKGVSGSIVETVMLEMQLEKLRGRVYTSLSGGEKQRVQLARVLGQIWDVCDHACLYLDEPTAALDLSHQIGLFNTLEQLQARGATTMVVLHDLNLALRYAGQVILLSRGRLLASGDPLEVLSVDNIREAFEVDIDMYSTSPGGRPFLLARA